MQRHLLNIFDLVWPVSAYMQFLRKVVTWPTRTLFQQCLNLLEPNRFCTVHIMFTLPLHQYRCFSTSLPSENSDRLFTMGFDFHFYILLKSYWNRLLISCSDIWNTCPETYWSLKLKLFSFKCFKALERFFLSLGSYLRLSFDFFHLYFYFWVFNSDF